MAKRLLSVYLLLTVSVVVLLTIGPMNFFDALNQGFATVSTGGFSTKQASIAYWDSPYIESVLLVFMFLSAVNFPLLYFLLQGKWKKFAKDEELNWFIAIIVCASLLVAGALFFSKKYGVLASLRYAVFQVVSIISTTGFTTGDYTDWGNSFLLVFMFLMIICGCAGSTSGGLKVVRTVVLFKNTVSEFERLAHPRAIIPVRLNGTAVSFGVVQRLLAFAFLYMSIIFVSWGMLTVSGLGVDEALGASISAIGNVGPGFGSIGPSGSYADLSAFAKYVLSFLMVVGRLELFTILILFTPSFWKR
jgi:trk system potassium uptake protein TrkH